MTTDNRPLTGMEKALVRAAEIAPWTDDLRWMLARVLERRGYQVGQFDNCGDLVQALETFADTR